MPQTQELNNMEYLKFIEQCRLKNYLNLLTQIHHIIPKSQGGTDDEKNKIKLSVHDHFWAHVYYAKEYGKCLQAPNMMLKFHCSKKDFTEIEWDKAAKIVRELLIKSNKTRIVSSETKDKIRKSLTGKKASEKTKQKLRDKRKNRIFSEESRNKMSKTRTIKNSGNHWYTNGQTNKFCKECPVGFYKGMFKKPLTSPKIQKTNKKIKCITTNKEFVSIRLAERETGINRHIIYRILSGKILLTDKLIFEYI